MVLWREGEGADIYISCGNPLTPFHKSPPRAEFLRATHILVTDGVAHFLNLTFCSVPSLPSCLELITPKLGHFKHRSHGTEYKPTPENTKTAHETRVLTPYRTRKSNSHAPASIL